MEFEKIKKETEVEKETKLKLEFEKLEIKKKKLELELVKSKSCNKIINIQNNIINNDNRQIIICGLGNEDTKAYSQSEIKLILLEGLNSILVLADTTHFNSRLPQNHNFYTSALNDKYANTFDVKTNTIQKTLKNELFDKLLNNYMNKLEILAKSNKRFMPTYNKLNEIVYLKKGRKQFAEQINMLSYNKRFMVMETLSKLLENQNITLEEANQIEEDVQQIIQTNNVESDSDTDSSSNHNKKVSAPTKFKNIIRIKDDTSDSDSSSSDNEEDDKTSKIDREISILNKNN